MKLHRIPANSRRLRKRLYRGCGFAILPIGPNSVQCGTLAETFNRNKRQHKVVKITLDRKCPEHVRTRPAPREMTSYESSEEVLGCFRLCALISWIKKLVGGLIGRKSFITGTSST